LREYIDGERNTLILSNTNLMYENLLK